MRKRNSSQGFNHKTKFLTEVIYGVVVLFIFAVSVLISFNLYSDFNNEIQNSTDFNPISKEETATNFERFDNTTDGLVLTIAIFLLIVLLGLSWYSYSNPIIMVILIVLLLALLIVGAILSNTWAELSEDSTFSAQADLLPITNNLMSNFVMYVLVVITSCGLVLFMRTRG